MTTYRRVIPDVVVAAVVGAGALGLGVFVVKSPLLAVGGLALAAMVLVGAVDATYPALAWLAVAPFVQAIEPGSPLLALTMAFHRVLLPVVGLSTLLGQSVRRQLRLLVSEKLMLAFLAYAFVSLYMSWRGSFGTLDGAEAVRTFLFAYVVPFGALLIGVRLRASSHRKVLGMLALTCGAAISLGGVLQSATGLAIFPGAGVWQDVWHPRAVGSLANPAVSAYVAHVGTFAAIYLAFRYARWRVVGIVAALAGAAFTILTYTRSAWVAFAVGIVAIAWLYSKARPWVVVGIALAAIAFSLNVGGFVDSAFLEERASNQENVHGRFAFGSTGVRMFEDEPIVGQGFGTYDVRARDFAAGFGQVGAGVAVADTSHNSFLTILAELGAVGFLLYAAAIFAALKTIVSGLRGGGVDRLKVVALVAGLLSYFVSANLIDMRFFSFAVSLFWFNLGLAVASARRSDRAAGPVVP